VHLKTSSSQKEHSEKLAHWSYNAGGPTHVLPRIVAVSPEASAELKPRLRGSGTNGTRGHTGHVEEVSGVEGMSVVVARLTRGADSRLSLSVVLGGPDASTGRTRCTTPNAAARMKN